MITAKIPTADSMSKEMPVFSVNQDKELTPEDKTRWLIKIKDDN